MSIIGDLNEAARKDHNLDRANLARQLAWEIDYHIKQLAKTAGDREAMRWLNGIWARAEKLLKIMGEPAPLNPRSDEVQVDERKAA